MRVRSLAALAALLPALLLGACNGDDDDSPAPIQAASATSSPPPGTPGTPAPEPTETPGGFSGGTSPVTATPPAGLQQAVLGTIRAAAHEGYDRIVFEFQGAQVPGYTVKLDTKAVNCGSGQDVTSFIGGGSPPDGLLIVDLRPAAAHDASGQATAVRELEARLGTIKRAFRTCDFEGVVTYAIGLSGEEPFKVSTLQAPPRLVIDIANK